MTTWSIGRGRAQRRGDRLDGLGLGREEPGRDLGLLEDLVAEGHRGPARRVTRDRRAGPGSRISPASARASASSESGRIE